MAKIKIKNSVTSGLAPSGLSFGEMAVNITDRKIFIGNAVEGVVTLHDQSNIVTSVNGFTGAVTNLNASTVTTTATNINATRYLAFVGGTGNTGIFIDDVTTPLTYTPAGGAIGAKKLTLTTSANVITLDSATPSITLTDGANIAEYGVNSFGANSATPFTITNQIGLTLDSNVIGFKGAGYNYTFPTSSGSNGQVLTTNGSGTLTWQTPSGSVTSVNGATGAITNVAKTNTTQTFTQLQDFSAGISASTGTNVIDVIATTDGCGLRIAQAASGSNARIGGIQLGRGSSNSANSYIENYVGQLNFFNGISGTNETPGTNMLQLSTTNAIFGVPIAGATFSGLIQSTSGISASGGITTASYVYAESGFRVGSGAINSQTGTTYTLLAADNGEVIVWNTSAGATLTIPSGLPVGFNATLIQTGTATIGITGSGTTLNSFEGKLRTAGQHAAVSIISYSSNVFNVAGGLTA